ncbi:MAG: cbb3-type cytochrome oxidase assembly protein CcoS [Pseudomonadota bacterium]
MQILIFLIPVSLALGALGVGAFLWAIRTRQFSDLEGDGARILLDKEPEDY